MKTLPTVISTTRPPFLLLTPAILSLAYAISYWQQGFLDFNLSLLVFIAALCAHISVNALNEYHDFHSGLDLNTSRTPFSGGSGGLPNNPSAAPAVLLFGLLSLAVTGIIGLYFISLYGPTLLPIGLIGIILVISYTKFITRYPWLCLIAPGLAFGPIFILGSNLVLTGHYSSQALIASLPIFFLVNNLLLLNQFPDQHADQQFGRKHIVIAEGKQKSSQLFVYFNLFAYLTLVLAVLLEILPTEILLGLIPIVLAFISSRSVIKNHQDIRKLLPAMASNVAINIMTPILMALGLVWSW